MCVLPVVGIVSYLLLCSKKPVSQANCFYVLPTQQLIAKKRAHRSRGAWSIGVSILQSSSEKAILVPGLVNIQIAIENGHRNSGFTH